MKVQTVLFFPSLYPSVTGGMEIYDYHLTNGLLAMGKADILLITADKRNIAGKKRYYANNRLFLTRKWGFDILSMLVYCLFNPNTHIRQWRHVMIPYTSSFGLCAWPFLVFKILFSFNFSVHCHGGGLKEWKNPGLQRKFLGCASHVAAVSETICREYSMRLGFEVRYLPPLQQFVTATKDKDEIREHYGVTKFEKILLYAGSIKPLKSLETLLEAYSMIGTRIREELKTVLLVAGDGPLRQELEEKYVDKDIVFLGRVPNENMNELYKISDIYVIPSWYEGTSLSLLEAMFNGLCCIGTNVNGINGMIKNEETGLLFEKNDSKGLSSILNKVLTNDLIAHSYGENAFAFYQTYYSYSNHLNEVLKFLDYNN